MVEGVVYEGTTPRDGFEVVDVFDAGSEFGTHDGCWDAIETDDGSIASFMAYEGSMMSNWDCCLDKLVIVGKMSRSGTKLHIAEDAF